ncbi:MbtH family protein [Pseudomonas entomophila]|uniref:MbtH family protein n=1 Tax=Pseudomonas entomophila TaxID=312306 RepID=UPI0015E39E5A|nr:MbtH family protein [Pseudomonas entomophila]MBA1189539.1 MbtH family protein [Pseudomonas entomophila]
MTFVFDCHDFLCQGVVSHAEPYAPWPDDQKTTDGQRAVGTHDLKRDSLVCSEALWADRRPLSLRQTMAEPASAP